MHLYLDGRVLLYLHEALHHENKLCGSHLSILTSENDPTQDMKKLKMPDILSRKLEFVPVFSCSLSTLSAAASLALRALLSFLSCVSVNPNIIICYQTVILHYEDRV